MTHVCDVDVLNVEVWSSKEVHQRLLYASRIITVTNMPFESMFQSFTASGGCQSGVWFPPECLALSLWIMAAEI